MSGFKGIGSPVWDKPHGMPSQDAGKAIAGSGAGVDKKTYSAKSVRVYTLDLATARTDIEFLWKGSLLWVCKGYDTSGGARDAAAEASFRLADRGNDAIPMVQGNSIAGVPFDRVFVTNTAQADKTLTIVVIDDQPGDEVSAQ